MTTASNIIHLESNKTENSHAGCKQCMRRSLCLACFVDESKLDEFEDLIHHSRPVQKGQSIIRAGDQLDRLYFVRSGKFKSYRLNQAGSTHITAFHLPGELMGLDDIHTGVHSDYIEALETGSVCGLSMTGIEKLMVKLPALVTQLLGRISAELHSEKDMMYLLGNLDAEQKLASFLLNYSERSHRSGFSADSIQLTMTRGDIANYLGMAVETISRVLQRLRDQRILHIDYRTIDILDREGLESIVAGRGTDVVTAA